jgi:hypothetical protein
MGVHSTCCPRLPLQLKNMDAGNEEKQERFYRKFIFIIVMEHE